MSRDGGPQAHPHVTCLGCGCGCDDITIHVQTNRIVEAANACPLGRQWFGDGTVATAIQVDHADATLDTALHALATMLTSATAPLIYIAPPPRSAKFATARTS